jgi:small subunit ribosomal protein S6
MRKYELTLIVAPQVDSDGLDAIIDQTKEIVGSYGGEVFEAKLWGLRRLAYPIRDYEEGQYVAMEIGLEQAGLTEMDRVLKLNELVIRHLVVRTDED